MDGEDNLVHRLTGCTSCCHKVFHVLKVDTLLDNARYTNQCVSFLVRAEAGLVVDAVDHVDTMAVLQTVVL